MRQMPPSRKALLIDTLAASFGSNFVDSFRALSDTPFGCEQAIDKRISCPYVRQPFTAQAAFQLKSKAF